MTSIAGHKDGGAGRDCRVTDAPVGALATVASTPLLLPGPCAQCVSPVPLPPRGAPQALHPSRALLSSPTYTNTHGELSLSWSWLSFLPADVRRLLFRMQRAFPFDPVNLLGDAFPGGGWGLRLSHPEKDEVWGVAKGHHF